MKKNKHKQIFNIVAGIMIIGSIGYILFLLSPLAGFSFNREVGQENIQDSYSYENDQHKFGFEFPLNYAMDDKNFNSEGAMYIVTQDAKWDEESGVQLKGSTVYISSKKIDATLKEYVISEGAKFSGISEDQIIETSINNKQAVIFDAKNSVPIKYPGVKDVYIQNGDKILTFSLLMGAQTTQEEFDKYLKQFNEIISTIYFL